MRIRIQTHPLWPTVTTSIELPNGSQALYVGRQDFQIFLWVAHNLDAESSRKRRFTVVGEGQDLQVETSSYVGTVQMDDLVWHVFEVAGES
jgi:hypothetical protein